MCQSHCRQLVTFSIATHTRVLFLFSGVQEASGEDAIQAGHAAVSLGRASPRGPGLQAHVEPGVCLPSAHRVPAGRLQRGVAGQRIRVLGQEYQRLQISVHTTRSLPQLRGYGRCEGMGGE